MSYEEIKSNISVTRTKKLYRTILNSLKRTFLKKRRDNSSSRLSNTITRMVLRKKARARYVPPDQVKFKVVAAEFDPLTACLIWGDLTSDI